MAVAVSETWQPSPSADAAELVDPVASARAAGLRYVSDQSPGLRRKRAGKGFTYVDSGGRAPPEAGNNYPAKPTPPPPPLPTTPICPAPPWPPPGYAPPRARP